MEINITLLGQLITFSVFVWFTMKFVWPPILNAMKERERRIAEGLAAAERGQQALELAQLKANEYLQKAKHEAADIIEQANKRANQLSEESKEQIRLENERLLAIARADIQQEWQAAQQKLRAEVANLVIIATEKILAQSLDSVAQHALVKQSLEEI
ncbi:F0F1 ATP synthase subunit B [Rickettsiella grylli]|uniref:ATP synthase subunit b n=1 Tax=Rickettsiella grylli TaxID=59196 RepID=A8PQF0_9COXI|nr:F0F1 ATP synthase subunit B [Rickettsiella grylli]EDP46720.1 ATP synthase F0, B subunit [Rickettsiella grylli]OIZ99472.1 F0F1 ATP synthase subunit B [Rickettsiella grylli]